ncbi:hypothetical protein NECAME_10836 [Necator americanus]|uniref:Uncharacterized protein n=1 Tax=Necator americanus TaxID=51031 RepID=W2T801_NECAM|nr:hypothetical protein NECAME_10836 [Necator americanus]ETN77744.1 hypothetical protein NECAME_10836 [Necator americanus]
MQINFLLHKVKYLDMKRSNDQDHSESPRKIPRRDREDFESLDKEALVEKILTIAEQLDKLNETVNAAKTRESLWLQKAAEKDKEIHDLVKERNSAYFSGVSQRPAQRDQLIDPFFYESFLLMKDKISAQDKIIAENQETIKSLQKNKDSEILSQFMKTKALHTKKVRDNEKNLRTIATLGSHLALAHTILRAKRQEKRDYTTEMAERDAKIADLYKELYSLRSSLSEESASTHSEDMDSKDNAKLEMNNSLDEKPLFEDPQISNDVAAAQNGNGIDVEVSVSHNTNNSNEEELDRPSNDERSVSLGDNGSLKITV